MGRAAFIFIIAFLLYLPALWYGFSYDDFHQISFNTLVTHPAHSIENLATPFYHSTLPGDLYRPVTLLSYRLNFLIGALNPFSYHLVNILLHALCSVMAYLLALGIVPQREMAAAIAALIFAVHPVHVEAVASVVGRAELLAAFFGCASILVISTRVMPSWLSLWLSAILFIIAALSKESALTLCPLIPLYIALSGREPGSRHSKELPPLWAVCLITLLATGVVLWVRSEVLGSIIIDHGEQQKFYSENPLLALSFTERLVPALKILGDYLVILIAPLHLSADYSLSYDDFWRSIFSCGGLLSLLLLFASLLLVLALRRQSWAFWGLWYFTAFALSANVIFPIGTVMAERLAYLPSIGFCLFAVYLALHLMQGRHWGMISTAQLPFLVIAVFIAKTWTRLPVWYDDLTLHTATLRDAPQSPKAAMNLGLYWYHARKDHQASEPYFRRVLALEPRNVKAAIFLIDISNDRKDYARAEYWCRKVLEWEPQNKKVKKKLDQLLELKERLKALGFSKLHERTGNSGS